MSYQPVMSPWVPEIYSRGSRSRYAQYPTFTRTPIPGAGFNRRLVMASQPLDLSGLGSTAPRPGDVVNIVAGLITNPEETLKSRGPALVSAIDKHVTGPLIKSAAKQSAPYVVKYVLPPVALIIVTSALGAWFGYKVARKIGA